MTRDFSLRQADPGLEVSVKPGWLRGRGRVARPSPAVHDGRAAAWADDRAGRRWRGDRRRATPARGPCEHDHPPGEMRRACATGARVITHPAPGFWRFARPALGATQTCFGGPTRLPIEMTLESVLARRGRGARRTAYHRLRSSSPARSSLGVLSVGRSAAV